MAKEKKKATRAQQEEAELEKAYTEVAKPGKYAKGGAPKNNRTLMIVGICIAVVAIILGIAAGAICIQRENNGVILENVTVAGVDVGGMTKENAINAVRLATDNTYSKKTMVVTVLDSKVEISPADSQITLNVEKAVRAAYKYGRSGSSSKRQQEQATAANTGYAVDLTPYFSLNTDTVKQLLNELGKKYSSTLVQSTYQITGEKPDLTALDPETTKGQMLVITKGIPEYGLNMDSLYAQLMAAYSANVFQMEGQCDTIEPDALDLEAILEEVYLAPVDATLDTETYEVIPSSYGYGFDPEAVKKALEETGYGEKLEVPITVLEPEISTQALSDSLFKDVLGTYTSANASIANRNVNLSIACNSINGMIIKPGQVFSYNQALGERTAEKGYKPGASYLGNKTVYTLGGGICQVSSTLYYCTLFADLEIVSRTPHGFAPSYLPLGMDATVSWGGPDFKFRNNTNYPIRIEASSSGGKVTVTLLGTDEKDYYVKMEYEVLSKSNWQTVYEEMEANNTEGYRDGQEITSPYTGYNVKSYKCKYDKATDALLSRNYEATSNYSKRDRVICKIKTAAPAPTTPAPTPTTPTEPVTPGTEPPISQGPVTDSENAQLPDE